MDTVRTEKEKRDRYMSVDRDYYVIAGYDLTDLDTDKFDDWKWTDEGQKYFCYQNPGHIQFFDDPMCGNYLYFGYVLANCGEYNPETTKFNANAANQVEKDVKSELMKLIYLGVISKDPHLKQEYKVIMFEQCT